MICSKDNKTREIHRKQTETHMGDSCWPRDAQACLVRLGGFVARKEVERRALHANRRASVSGSDQSREKEATRLERQIGQTGARTSSAVSEHSLRVARMLLKQRPDGGLFAAPGLVQLSGSTFFSFSSASVQRSRWHAGHWPDASMLAGLAEEGRSRETRREM